MKSKVIIENGETEIVLTAENRFEEDFLDKIYSNRNGYSINTEIKAHGQSGFYSSQRIVINLKEKK